MKNILCENKYKWNNVNQLEFSEPSTWSVTKLLISLNFIWSSIFT